MTGWAHAAWAEKNRELLFLFLRYGTPDWAEGEEGLCVCGYSKGLWDLSEDIKSLLLSLYNSLNIQSLSFSPISGIERCLSLAVGKANLVQGGGPLEHKSGSIR